jgi:hypothetical protein
MIRVADHQTVSWAGRDNRSTGVFYVASQTIAPNRQLGATSAELNCVRNCRGEERSCIKDTHKEEKAS